jgi:hypothetical protein
MRSCARTALLLFIFGLGSIGVARSETTVRVLDTYPSGDTITLARNQNFNLRLAYSTDQPAGIWITPYFQGKRVNAGTSPSQPYSGTGEALAWFFFMKPGSEVDEIRITAGDGGTNSTPLVATYRVRIVGGESVASAAPPPDWVIELGERAKVAQQQALKAHMSKPTSASDMALFGGFMLAMLAVGIAGFAAPAWSLWRWRGGWRIAAAVPAAIMAFVVLRIVIDTSRDPTSHNLWPFEILMAGALSAGITVALMIARKLAGTARTH